MRAQPLALYCAAGGRPPVLPRRSWRSGRGLSRRGINDLERGARLLPRKDAVTLLADALGLAGDGRSAFLAAARRPLSLAEPAFAPTPEAQEAPGSLETSGISVPSSPLPQGTVTFLFTDIEGSTRLLQQLEDAYAGVLGAHQALLRAAFVAHGGTEVDTQGDAFFVAFASAPEAVACAVEATQALAAHSWPEGVLLRVRLGLHTGTPQRVGDHYVGIDVHRAARIAAAGHGGQILLSQTTRELVAHTLPDGVTLRDLGAHHLKDLQHPERITQVVQPGLPADFPLLKTLDMHQHNLPIQPTPLLGRQEQVVALTGLLCRDDVRLVTLTGAGALARLAWRSKWQLNSLRRSPMVSGLCDCHGWSIQRWWCRPSPKYSDCRKLVANRSPRRYARTWPGSIYC